MPSIPCLVHAQWLCHGPQPHGALDTTDPHPHHGKGCLLYHLYPSPLHGAPFTPTPGPPRLAHGVRDTEPRVVLNVSYTTAWAPPPEGMGQCLCLTMRASGQPRGVNSSL